MLAKNPPLLADLVLEGGGVKGVGLGGATAGLVDAGYAFPRVAGWDFRQWLATRTGLEAGSRR